MIIQLSDQFITINKHHFNSLSEIPIEIRDPKILSDLFLLFNGYGSKREQMFRELIQAKRYKNSEIYYVYFMLLISDYVIEIVELVNKLLDVQDLKTIKAIFEINPDFYKFVGDRAVSYWNQFYRKSNGCEQNKYYKNYNDYPAKIFFDKLIEL